MGIMHSMGIMGIIFTYYYPIAQPDEHCKLEPEE